MRTCHPTDGLYKKGHVECNKCNQRAKRVCQLFALHYGVMDVEDLEQVNGFSKALKRRRRKNAGT